MTISRKATVVVALGGAIALGACGGQDAATSGSAPVSTSATTPAPPAANTTAPISSSASAAYAAVGDLRLAVEGFGTTCYADMGWQILAPVVDGATDQEICSNPDITLVTYPTDAVTSSKPLYSLAVLAAEKTAAGDQLFSTLRGPGWAVLAPAEDLNSIRDAIGGSTK